MRDRDIFCLVALDEGENIVIVNLFVNFIFTASLDNGLLVII